MTSFKKPLMCLMLSGTILTGAMAAPAMAAPAMAAPAMAAPAMAAPAMAGTFQAGDLSPAEMTKYEQEIENLFTKVLYQTPSGWKINSVEAAKYGITQNQSIQFLQVLNGLTSTPLQDNIQPGDSLRHRIGSNEYNRCVLNAVGLGFLAGAATGGGSQLGYLLATQNWREVAWVLARLVGVNALKGGLVGIVTYLVAAGGWCATPWAT